MSKIIDISPRVSARIGVWPGDTPFQREVLLDMADGANLTLSTIHTTVHLGAHTDAPNHYEREGSGIADVPLEPYLGPCQVIHVSVARGARIYPSDLTAEVTRPRILLRTDTFPDPDNFNEDFASLSVELVDHLHERGVSLVGIDTPSVDLFHDKVLESHNAIARCGLRILEGVVLTDVDPGSYTLVALPLPLEGCDASPVRAVLLGE
jgi:arylformamidase